MCRTWRWHSGLLNRSEQTCRRFKTCMQEIHLIAQIAAKAKWPCNTRVFHRVINDAAVWLVLYNVAPFGSRCCWFVLRLPSASRHESASVSITPLIAVIKICQRNLNSTGILGSCVYLNRQQQIQQMLQQQQQQQQTQQHRRHLFDITSVDSQT